MTVAAASVEAYEKARLDAMAHGHVEALNRMLADEMVYVHSMGIVESKRSYVENIASGRVRYDGVTFTTDDVTVFGSTAVVRGTMTVPLPDPDRPTTSISLAVWALRETGDWQLVSYQGTRAEPPRS